MAIDKAIDSVALHADLKGIADSIRAKGGTSAQFASAAAMKAAVDAIQTGGGGGDVTPFDHIEVKTWVPGWGEVGYAIENPTNLEAFAIFRLSGSTEYGITAAAIRCSAEGGWVTPRGLFSGSTHDFQKPIGNGNDFYLGDAYAGYMPQDKSSYIFSSDILPEMGETYAVVLCYGPLKS